MKLGILVTTDKHLDDVLGITNAAVAKGHEVTLFNMDDGNRLLENPAFTALCKVKGVHMAYCDHSAHHLGIDKEKVLADIVCGSQFNNANMMHDSDRVISL